MEWIVAAALGGIIGTLMAFVTQDRHIRMPGYVAIIIGAIGGLAGGAIAKIAGFYAWGAWTFYAAAIILSIGFLSGSILARTLTNEETRV